MPNMRVIKVLNNSLVLALNQHGQEIILMGKGIGYNKSIGYQFAESEIEKVFLLQDQETSRNIIRLASEIDSLYFELAKTVIDYAVEKYRMKLMEHIYLSLTDHLAFAVKRMQDGIILQNFYTLDMRNFNPDEFDVGEFAIRLLQKRLNIRFPRDEAGNIAFHFINAQYSDGCDSKNLRIVQTVNDILKIVKSYYNLTYLEESTEYARYVTHVRLFAQRLESGHLLQEEKGSLLYEQIATVCTSEFDCVRKIGLYVKGAFNLSLSNQEEMYLAVHIHRILGEYA